MYERLVGVEDWVTYINAQTMAATTEYKTDPIQLLNFVAGSGILPGCDGMEFAVTVTSAGNDDCTWKNYACPDGLSAYLAVEPRTSETLDTGSAWPDNIYRNGIYVPVSAVGSGLVVGVYNTGASIDMVLTVKGRRMRRLIA